MEAKLRLVSGLLESAGDPGSSWSLPPDQVAENALYSRGAIYHLVPSGLCDTMVRCYPPVLNYMPHSPLQLDTSYVRGLESAMVQGLFNLARRNSSPSRSVVDCTQGRRRTLAGEIPDSGRPPNSD